jgi:DNA polymerase I-like protein with 3'-5' exonuclease and polymerase domains
LPPYKYLRTVEGAGSVYNAADLIETYYLWTRYIAPYLERDPQARAVYETESLPFIDLQIEGVEAGIAVHPTEPLRLWAHYGQKREQAQTLAEAYAGYPMSLSSPDQLKHYLYNVEALPIQRKRAGRGEQGPATTDKDALAALRRREGTEWDEADEPTLASAMAAIDGGGHPVLEARFLYMGAAQAMSHYILPLLEIDDA